MADWWKRFKAMNALQGGDPGTPILVDYRQFQKAGNKEGVEILKKQNEAAAELAKKKGKATVNALTFIGGLKNPFGLLGDLGITTISTLANTALDGNTDNLTKNLATNAMFDVAGKGAGDAISYVGKKIRPVLQKIIKRTPKTSYAPVLSIDTNDKFVQNNYYVDFLNEYSQVDPKGAEQLKYYLTLPEIPAPEVGSYEDVLGNVYSTDWYINRLRNIGMYEQEIASVWNKYAQNLNNVEWRVGPRHDLRNAWGSSMSVSGRPDGPKLIWINNSTPKSELPNVKAHEALHMSGLGGEDLHPRIQQNNAKYYIPTNHPELRKKDEQRVRLLRFAKYAEDKFNGDYTAAAEHILEGWLNPRYQTPGRDVEMLFEHFDKDDVINAGKHILGISAPVGVAGISGKTIEKKQSGGPIKPNFLQRLEDPNRKSIPDWMSFKRNPLFNNRGEFTNNYVDDLINAQHQSISTHKMGYEYTPDDSGRAIVYPKVQEINGKLVDFTRPPYHSWVGYASALDRGDYLVMKDLEDARKWVEGYKDRYKNLK